jgi:hypothetical protein
MRSYFIKSIFVLILLSLPISWSQKETFMALKVRTGEQSFLMTTCSTLRMMGARKADLIILDGQLTKWFGPIQAACFRNTVLASNQSLPTVEGLSKIVDLLNPGPSKMSYYFISSKEFLGSKKVEYKFSDFINTNRPTPTKVFYGSFAIWVGKFDPSKNITFTQSNLEVTLGNTYGFNSSTDYIQGLGHGWSLPESWGTWTIGPASTIFFQAKSGVSTQIHTLTIKGIPFISGSHDVIDLNFYLNSNLIYQTKLRLPSTEKTLVFPIPQIKTSRNILTFKIDKPMSPKSLHLSDDARELGFGLVSIKFS